MCRARSTSTRSTRYLQFQYVPHPLSAFAALRKLPPAHTLAWQDGRSRDPALLAALVLRRRTRTRSEAEMHERIRDELLEATRLRLRSDVPLGAFLSGGVDSERRRRRDGPAAARHRSRPSRSASTSAEFDETRVRPRGRRALRHRAPRVPGRAAARWRSCPKLVWHYGEPFADPSAIPSFYLAELTRRARDGRAQRRRRRRGLRGLPALRRPAASPTASTGCPAPLAPCGGRRCRPARARPEASEPAHELDRLAHALSMDALRALRDVDRVLHRADRRPRSTRPSSRAHAGRDAARRSVVIASSVSRLGRDDARRPAARRRRQHLPAGRPAGEDGHRDDGHSLEVRSPLLDHASWRWRLACPPRRSSPGRRRSRSSRTRCGPGFPTTSSTVRRWASASRSATGSGGRCASCRLRSCSTRARSSAATSAPRQVRSIIDRHLSGAEDTSNKIWALLQLELWLRTYVDSERPAPLAIPVG